MPPEETIIPPTITEGNNPITEQEFLEQVKKEKPEITEKELKKLRKIFWSQPVYSKTPIEKPSSCDVYRNNKIFLNQLAFMKETNRIDELKEKYWATTKEEADKMFEENNKLLPYWWYNKLKKIYESFNDVFTH